MYPILLLTLIISLARGQDIVFPGMTSEFTSSSTRFSLTDGKTTCSSPNMAYVPEDETCECLIGMLYYPPKDNCYVPYQQGPCSPGNYLILPKGYINAECIHNTCGNNGTIPYRGKCVRTLTPGDPCPEEEALVVDENTYDLVCRVVKLITHQIITAPIAGCKPGTRRAGSGRCRTVL